MTDDQTPIAAPVPDAEPPVTTPPAAPAPAAPVPAVPAPAPAVAWQTAPPPVVAAKGQRTPLAMVAGILLLLGGILGALLGLLIAVVGGTFVSSLNLDQFGSFPELSGADAGKVVGGVVTVVGIIILAYSIAYVLAGIGVLRNSNWARVLGIVVGVISGLIWLSGVANAGQVADAGGAAANGLFSIVLLVIHAYIVVALLFFWRTKPTV